MIEYRGLHNEPITEQESKRLWRLLKPMNDTISHGITVSTMWDGWHRPESGPFETVVFLPNTLGADLPMYHWPTKLDAIAGHRLIVLAARTLLVTGGQ